MGFRPGYAFKAEGETGLEASAKSSPECSWSVESGLGSGFGERPKSDGHGQDPVGIYGGDIMRELDAVITYREMRLFLRQK